MKRVNLVLPIAVVWGCCAAQSGDGSWSPVRSFTVEEVGRSVGGEAIRAVVFKGDSPPVLVIGGIHGSEPSSVDLVNALARYLVVYPEDRAGRQVVLIPRSNPDGLRRGRRTNANNVDLNRNFKTANFNPKGPGGTEPLSEPESRAIAQVIERYRPFCIVSIHAPLNCIDPDGGEASRVLAQAMADAGPLRVKDLRAEPGSLGSYAGLELGLTMITYEADRRTVSPEYVAAYVRPHVASLLVAIRAKHNEA